MTGLDLESFLELLRADLGAWASFGVVAFILALMTWTSLGSRRALRKCLVLSVGAHVGLVLYGSTQPLFVSIFRGEMLSGAEEERPTRRVSVAPVVEGERASARERAIKGLAGQSADSWDRASDLLAMASPPPRDVRPEPKPLDLPEPTRLVAPGPIAAETAEAKVEAPAPTAPAAKAAESPDLPSLTAVAPGDANDVARPVVAPSAGSAPLTPEVLGSRRLNPDRIGDPRPNEPARPRSAGVPSLTNAPELAMATPELGLRPRASAEIPGANAPSASSTTEIPASKPFTADRAAVREASPIADRNLRSGARQPAPSPGAAVGPTARPRAPLAMSGPSAMPELNAPSSAPTASLGRRPSSRASGSETPIGVASEPAQGGIAAPAPVRPATVREALPEADLRRQSRPGRASADAGDLLAMRAPDTTSSPISLNRVAPDGTANLPPIQGAAGLSRPLTDIPSVYRSRLDPNRTALAQRAGASRESEQAVERALDWLSRHQDADGRWDGGTARYKDGSVAEGDDDYTIHCPNGDVCFGPCYYWEGDTALTGLSLLAYLGSGYTHTDGKYADTVSKGLNYLRLQQKPDGDLRGRSVAVGMYCHAMATLALCEAYALTGDPKLRVPVERAVAFLVRSRAKDNLAWRYAPGAPVGDTSILGWVVMVLKSAKEVGIPIPPTIKQGTTTWLSKVSSGPNGGLAKYQPWENVTPTMTAEAWVCRQFLEVGNTSASSAEAADFLLDNGPSKGQFNLYYWYYGTLAMYQHGGPAWTRWNREVRDGIVRRQRTGGHATGSWDPDESQYGTHGGRIYCTALATLSLEVYYRYLRLYDAPPATVAPSIREPSDAALRRSGQLP